MLGASGSNGLAIMYQCSMPAGHIYPLLPLPQLVDAPAEIAGSTAQLHELLQDV